jgi:glycosyltransferase involved in cell wall biosynthesis
MLKNKTIGVVVPAYNEESQISGVISTMPDFVDKIIVVDDKSTDQTIRKVEQLKNGPGLGDRIILVALPANEGVGGAIAAGYRWARDNKVDVTAVMAGDGQMAPGELASIVGPILDGTADYVKGNRLLTEHSWKTIPRSRFIGNAALSFLTKIVSGYWSVVDSQTGYTAISLRALRTLNMDNIYKRYGVPNDILTKLNIYNFRIAQIPIEPVYNVGEKSKMRKSVVLFTIPCLLFRLFWYRMFYKYVVRDFHPIFLYYFFGIVLTSIGLLGGLTNLVLMVMVQAGAVDISVSIGWKLFFTTFFLSGLNLLFFGMWMDRDENKDLQINILPEGTRL